MKMTLGEDDYRRDSLKQDNQRLRGRVEMLERAVRGGMCALCEEVIGDEDWVLENEQLLHADGCQGE